jgi:hypothetical protein
MILVKKPFLTAGSFVRRLGSIEIFDMPSPDVTPLEHNDRLFVRFGSDPEQINSLFLMTLITILFYTSTAAAKMKPFFELQSDNLRQAHREFASSYFSRAEPVERFIKAQRGN